MHIIYQNENLNKSAHIHTQTHYKSTQYMFLKRGREGLPALSQKWSGSKGELVYLLACCYIWNAVNMESWSQYFLWYTCTVDSTSLSSFYESSWLVDSTMVSVFLWLLFIHFFFCVKLLMSPFVLYIPFYFTDSSIIYNFYQ